MTSTPRFWKISAILIVLFAAYASWMFLLRPAFKAAGDTRQEASTTWTQVDQARAKTRQLAEQKKDLQTQIDELMRLRAKIPKDVNVPLLMRTIQQEARREGVVLTALQPGEITLFAVPEPSPSADRSVDPAEPAQDAPKPSPSPTADLGQGLAPEDAGLAYVPLVLSGQGDYASIRDFITRVEHQQRAFLITVANIDRESSQGSGHSLTFTMEGRVFVLNGEEVRLPAALQRGE